MLEVIKRNGDIKPFDKQKIEDAIMKAMRHGSGIVKPAIAAAIAEEIQDDIADKDRVTIAEIEAAVFEKLIAKRQKLTAKAYESYRAVQEFKRNYTELDKRIEGIVDGTNKEAIDENSNKNAYIASTQRDLIAGEYSRDYCKRKLLPANVLQADEEGIIHVHDLDYFLEHIHNCCLVNLKDMLQNGTVINRKRINKPHSLHTATTIATQCVQQIANGQYGGQTISLAHLAPFVRISYEKYLEKYLARGMGEEFAEQFAAEDLKEEIKASVQTLQYQINTFSTSNGQAPFLSVFMYISEEPEYEKETAMLIEEVLRQRIQGMQNEKGVWITPAFPKLLYVTDENNIHPDSDYYYLTELAAECVSKRMMPDFISAKIMRQHYDGEVFPCMGCRSFLGPWKDENGKYKWYGRFNQGVVTLNLVDVALSSDNDFDQFWKVLDARLELCFKALMMRHERLLNTPLTTSPIHWKHGGLARLEGDNFNELLFNGYSSISLGYAGLYECVLAMTGQSHTTPEGEKFALEVMHHLRDTTDKWKKETTIGFSLYGTPLESTTDKLAKCLKKRFGIVEGVTDHDYVTNSYHVNVKEKIDAFDKLKFEAQFQNISSGGAISYVETCNLSNNVDVILELITFMYDNIQYAELNGKFDYCQACGFSGEILLDENNEWTCPNCGNQDHNKLNIARRTCGYIGDNFWNKGRTAEIKDRYVHVDNEEVDSDL